MAGHGVLANLISAIVNEAIANDRDAEAKWMKMAVDEECPATVIHLLLASKVEADLEMKEAEEAVAA